MPRRSAIPDKLKPDETSQFGHYAGFTSRLVAFMIDLAVIIVTLVVIVGFFSLTFSWMGVEAGFAWLSSLYPGLAPLISLLGPISVALLDIFFIIAYHVFFWNFTGQTPGKALIGLRVVTNTGQRLTVLRATLRLIAYFASAIPIYVGFLWILVDDDRRGWHDKIAKTCVVYAWDAHPDENFLVGFVANLKSLNQQARKRLNLAKKSSRKKPQISSGQS